MRDSTCSHMDGIHLIEKAGHWVQQEQPTRSGAHPSALTRTNDSQG